MSVAPESSPAFGILDLFTIRKLGKATGLGPSLDIDLRREIRKPYAAVARLLRRAPLAASRRSERSA